MTVSSPRRAKVPSIDPAMPTGNRTCGESVRHIILNLERTFGTPLQPERSDPLDMLIGTILSQATSDVNSHRSLTQLKKRFPSWEMVLRARTKTIADSIRAGGLADQKAVVIRNLLRQIKEERGDLDLTFLHDATPEVAIKFLERFNGIGPKTVACTLLFACGQEVFPLDTHIFRILRRLGMIPEKGTAQRAHELMTALVPAGKFYSFHVNLIRLGRRICRPRDPLCERCPIVE